MAAGANRLEQRGLVGRERGAERRHDVLDAGEHQPQHVEVALDQDDRLLLPDGALGLVQVVELPPLVKDRGLGRVEILGLARAEQPSAESHHPAAQVVNGEEQAAAEPRDHRAVVPLRRQAGLEQHPLLDAELAPWP